MKKYFASSELIINDDGSVFHLHVKPEWLADKVILVGDPGRVALVGSHLENHTMGEIALSPIGLSMVNKLTPIRFASLMMGIWYLSTATANKFAGTLSGLYPEAGKVKTLLGYRIETMYDFFMVFVVMSATASLILFLLSKKLQKMMHGVE